MEVLTEIIKEEVKNQFDSYCIQLEQRKSEIPDCKGLLDWCKTAIADIISSVQNIQECSNTYSNDTEIDTALNEIIITKFEDNESKIPILKNILETLQSDAINLILKCFDVVKDYYLYYLSYKKLDNCQCDDLYSILNKCIILDHISWDLDILKTIVSKTLNPLLILTNPLDYKIWKNSALLNFKLHDYKKAILFFDSVIKLINDDNQKYEELIKIKINKGYCLEFNQDFDAAIQHFESFEKELGKKMKEQPHLGYLNDAIHEVWHALGHCYNEKAITKNEDDGESIKKAREFLEKSVEGGEKYEKYKGCLGSIRAEFNEQMEAIKKFDEAFHVIPEAHKFEKAEILFYKGYSYSLLGKLEDAKTQYDEFEEICNKLNDKDGLAHVEIFKIKLELRNKRITELDQNTIIKWINTLIEREPSVYVNKSIKEEWNKTINFLKALYQIVPILKNETSLINSLGTIIHYLANCNPENWEKENSTVNSLANFKTFSFNKIPVYLIADKTFSFEKLEKIKVQLDNIGDKKYSIDTNVTNISEFISDNYQHKLGKERQSNVLIFFESYNNEIEDTLDHIRQQQNINYVIDIKNTNDVKKTISYNVTKRDCSIIELDDIEAAIKIVYILNALERIRLELINPKFFFVLTPLREVSVYNYQTGEINELIWERNVKTTNGNTEKNFKNQINNIDTFFKNKINADIEDNNKNISFCNHIINCLSGVSVKYSLFFPFETNKSDYRIVIKEQNEEPKSVKPYSNRKIEQLLSLNIASAINDSSKRNNCPLNVCNGQNEICRSIIKTCNPNNISDNNQQEYCYVNVVKDIPDLELDINKKYTFWLKYFERDDSNKDIIEGLLMIVLDENTTEKFEDYCEKMTYIKEENQTQNNEIVPTQIIMQDTIDQQTTTTYNTLKNKIQSFIDENNNNRNLTTTVNNAKQLLNANKVVSKENNQNLQTFISDNNI